MIGYLRSSLIFLSLLALLPHNALAQQEAPQAKAGVIDLKGWNPESDGRVPLKGEWKFFFGELLDSSEIVNIASRENPITIKDGQRWEDLGFEKSGYVTYVLEINNLEYAEPGLLIDQFFGQHKTDFYYYDENQQLIQVSMPMVGSVGKTNEETEPQFRKSIMQLPGNISKGWLVIKTSDFMFDGMIRNVPVVGNYATMYQKEVHFARREGFFILGSFFLLLVTNFSLFLQRNDDKASLYITGFALALGLRYFSTEGLWAEFAPDSGFGLWITGIACIALGLPVGLTFIISFLNQAFPKFVGKKIKLFSLIFSVLTAVTIAAGVATRTMNPMIFALVFMIFILFPPVLLYKTIRATLAGERGAGLAALGLAILLTTMLNDVMIGFSIYDGPFVGHYGMVAFIFTQSLVVGKNFAHAFRTADRLSRELKIEVERQTRDAKAILNSVQQGLMTVDVDGFINDDYSAFLKDILGEDQPEGKNIRDVFLDKTNLTREVKDMVMTVLLSSVGEDELAYEANADLLPSTANFEDDKIIELDWQPVVNEKTDEVEKILIALKDVTALKALEMKNKETQREIEIITRLLDLNNERFLLFYRSSKQMLAESRKMAASANNDAKETLRLLFVNMHTIKGAARTYALTDITTAAHECEQFYAEVQEAKAEWDADKVNALIDEVETYLDEYNDVNKNKLKREEENNVAKISLDTVHDHILELQQLTQEGIEDKYLPFIQHVQRTLYEVYFTDSKDFFGDIASKIPTMAKDLGKAKPNFELNGPHVGFSSEGTEILSNAFVHLIRNSLDHGIETAEIRTQKGKPEGGTVQVNLIEHEDRLEIQLTDDGAGIKLDRILEIARKQGLLEGDKVPPAKELAEYIFMAGFSTAASVTDISGRGVGMDAVRKMFTDVGGNVEIELAREPEKPEAVPFVFHMYLPNGYWAKIDSQQSDGGSAAA